MHSDILMTSAEAAEYRRVSKSTLAKERMRGDGPPYTCIRGRVFYRRGDIDAFLEAGRRRSTSEGQPLEGAR